MSKHALTLNKKQIYYLVGLLKQNMPPPSLHDGRRMFSREEIKRELTPEETAYYDNEDFKGEIRTILTDASQYKNRVKTDG